MLQLVKGLDFQDADDLDQDAQPNNLLMSAGKLSPTQVTQYIPWVLCRDYFNDLVATYHTERTFNAIYGLTVIPEMGDFDVLLLSAETAQLSSIHRNLDILHEVEETLGAVPSKLLHTDRIDVVGLEFDLSVFKTHTWMFHFYTLIIKCISHPDLPDNITVKDILDYREELAAKIEYGARDFGYIEKLNKYIGDSDKILEYLKASLYLEFPSFSYNCDPDVIHNHTGVISLAKAIAFCNGKLPEYSVISGMVDIGKLLEEKVA